MTDQTVAAAAWFVLAGAAGGLLNAVVSGNTFLLPVRIRASPHLRILRSGVVLNVLIGAGASLGARRAFGGPAPELRMASVDDLLLALVGGLCAGALAARWMTNEADKR